MVVMFTLVKLLFAVPHWVNPPMLYWLLLGKEALTVRLPRIKILSTTVLLYNAKSPMMVLFEITALALVGMEMARFVVAVECVVVVDGGDPAIIILLEIITLFCAPDENSMAMG